MAIWRFWVSRAIHVQNLAWNFRLACRPWRYGDRCDCSVGASWSPAPARLCREQEVRRLEPCRYFGPYRGCEYWGTRPAVRSQSPRSCFDCSHGTAPAGADSGIYGASGFDTASDCAVSGATPRQISKATCVQAGSAGGVMEHRANANRFLPASSATWKFGRPEEAS